MLSFVSLHSERKSFYMHKHSFFSRFIFASIQKRKLKQFLLGRHFYIFDLTPPSVKAIISELFLSKARRLDRPISLIVPKISFSPKFVNDLSRHADGATIEKKTRHYFRSLILFQVVTSSPNVHCFDERTFIKVTFALNLTQALTEPGYLNTQGI